MKDSKNGKAPRILSGVFFSLCAVFGAASLVLFLSNTLRVWSSYEHISESYMDLYGSKLIFDQILPILGFIAIAVTVFLAQKVRFAPVIGFGIAVFFRTADLVLNSFSITALLIYNANLFSATEWLDQFRTRLDWQIIPLSLCLVFAILSIAKKKSGPRRLWFLPGVIAAAGAVALQFLDVILSIVRTAQIGGGIGNSIFYILFNSAVSLTGSAVFVLAIFFAGKFLCTASRPETNDADEPPYSATGYASTAEPGAHYNMTEDEQAAALRELWGKKAAGEISDAEFEAARSKLLD